MDAEAARRTLLAQHQRLRVYLQMCTRLARFYRVRHSAAPELDLALEILREEFALHNEAETAMLRTLLHGPLIDRMVKEHLAEHAAFAEMLSGTRDEIALRIDALADELEAHIAAEEQTFLSPVAFAPQRRRVGSLRT